MLAECGIFIRRVNLRLSGILIVISEGVNIAIRINSLCYASASVYGIKVLDLED